MPHRVLLVDADPDALARTESVLSAAGYLVTSVSVFEEAKQRLSIAPPDLLMADVRLGAYNGLHLIVRGRADHPDMSAIVSHTVRDPVLEAEAKNAGAVYVVKPLEAAALLEIVRDLLAGRPLDQTTAVQRRWPRKRAAVTAKFGEIEATVLDLSYGGLRLELRNTSGGQLPQGVEISFPPIGQLPIRPVWAKRAGPAGPWWCGVEITAPDQRTAEAWRGFVDSVN